MNLWTWLVVLRGILTILFMVALLVDADGIVTGMLGLACGLVLGATYVLSNTAKLLTKQGFLPRHLRDGVDN